MKMRSVWRLLVIVVLVGACQKADAGPQATFVPLGDLPGGFFQSWAFDISDEGTIVAGSAMEEFPDTGLGWGPRAVRWVAGSGPDHLSSEVGVAGTGATAVSGNGAVISGVIFDAFAVRNAFLWNVADGLKLLEGCDCLGFDDAAGLSYDGSVVVGKMRTIGGPRAYRWSEQAGAINLGDLPGGSAASEARDVSADGSIVVGSSSAASGSHAFRWTAAGGMQDLNTFPELQSSYATAISSDGSSIAGIGTTSQGLFPIRWKVQGDSVALTVLDDKPAGVLALPDGSTIGGTASISDDGQVMAGESEGERDLEAFIWTEQSGMRSLKSVLTGSGVNMAGWDLFTAKVSADGTRFIGFGRNPAGNGEAYLAVIPTSNVPEPASSTGLMMAVGCCLLGRRRR